MEEFKKIPGIKGVPDDDIKRVALTSGAVYYNGRNSTIPLVEVLLLEVNTDNTLSDRVAIAKIGVPQLDSLRFGTVLIGERGTNQIWTGFKGYREKMSFRFDFRENEPESIRFDSENDKGYDYINRNKFSFDMIQNESIKSRFSQSQLTKLMTSGGVSVLFPALEVLTSLLVPAEQSMRSKLLMHSMDDVVGEYLQNYSYDATNNKYIIQYHNGSKKEANMAFLAYLAMNEITRARMSKIRSSIAQGLREEPKYPVVLPYHPTALRMVADGIWMDNKTFLCLRVKHMDPPRDYLLGEITERKEKAKEKSSPECPNDGGPNTQQQPFDIEDLTVTPENNPNTGSRRAYITSEVTVGSIKDIISKEVIIVDPDEENPSSSPPQSENNEEEQAEIGEAPEDLSSGDAENTQDSKGTGKLDQKENLINNPQERIDDSDLFTKIQKTLLLLKKDKQSPLANFYYIDSQGRRSSIVGLCDFLYSETRYAKSYTKWAYKKYNKKKKIFKPRGALLIELVLSDFKSAYILEIEQKSEGEKFAGLLFNVKDEFLEDEIQDLLVEIAKIKGVVRVRENESLVPIVLTSVTSSTPYMHYKDKESKLFTGVFSKLINTDSDDSVFQ